jgi:hypothetical protein
MIQDIKNKLSQKTEIIKEIKNREKHLKQLKKVFEEQKKLMSIENKTKISTDGKLFESIYYDEFYWSYEDLIKKLEIKLNSLIAQV